ncbi:addiction module toxin RelE [Candidatus Woesearchaeota archaeon CG10_big_fil_rev_8_21_14_0_10_34_12]|nr:MAG: addiction module toxin RelE [Candidatus Woesearchaeota archaeon CG10_big_fil_rev_8_21_14_0_10_34_12]
MPRLYKKSKHLDRILVKLENKNKQLYENLLNKMDEVLNSSDIEHYKNLRYNMKAYKRVQVGSFVLVFRLDKQTDLVYFADFDHLRNQRFLSTVRN